MPDQTRRHTQDLPETTPLAARDWPVLGPDQPKPAAPMLTPVQSSLISAIGHDGQALYIRFRAGGLYRYPTAGTDLHAALLSSGSVGQYFHRHIKSSHHGTRVDEGNP